MYLNIRLEQRLKEKELTKFKTNVTSLRNVLQKRIEQRIDNAKYRKEIKKIIPKILKNIKKIKKINIENQKYSRNLNSEKSINISDEQLNKNISLSTLAIAFVWYLCYCVVVMTK